MSRSAAEHESHPGHGSVEQFRAIAELHGDIAWIVDCVSGLPVYLSPSAAAISGYDLDDVRAEFAGGTSGGPLASVCAGLPERLRRFTAGDRSRERVVRQFELRLADGRTLPVEVSSTILVNAHGVAASVVGVVRDVSAAREQAARQRKFTSMLNHEFRTPLSTIDGAIQRLESGASAVDEPTRQRYRKIQAAVDRLIGIMDEYLSPERMAEAGASKPADSASPAVLLEEAAAMVRAAGREVVVELGHLPVSLRCQPSGLRMALKVLVDNALQYSPAAAPLVLTGMQADGGTVFQLRDAGLGVPEAELETIFGKRYRGSNALGAGSGLGLYMAKSVIEVHGGNISARNVAPAGAEFRIWLPAQSGTGKSVAS
ncbi:PAS domain-containing sensor histidine kinase [Massilia sp. CF038]|uniref:PAS domain-containing sensor histidine kinase n=1 Tax=Massilia sp. CF038 TaxID=1881045 RepID=UPI000921FF29|nr:PAS domain-containing sensor histidine kinase [Massilia sp. CF038]SHH65500.1 PAS domain S-box-containing protein [Massilia sp. CF038]